MPPALLDEDYSSEEDSDFAPDAQDRDAGQESGSEPGSEDDEVPPQEDGVASATATTTNAQKRKLQSLSKDSEPEAEDAGFENSGDEAIIQKGKRKRQKKDGGQGREDVEEGGEGGLIKTRSQRAAEKVERKAKVVQGPVTIDVDKVWAEMIARPIVPSASSQAEKEKDGGAAAGTSTPVHVQTSQKNAKATSGTSTGAAVSQTVGGDDSDMVLIKRKYNFAGKIHTEEKLVARSSAEAQLYLSSLAGGDPASTAVADGEALSESPRRIRRAYRSRFEPPMHVLQRADLNLLMASTLSKREAKEAKERAKKLNTVEKSRMDWAGFVDKEGLKEELELAGRSKGNYAEREHFLARSDGRREEDARRARIAGRD
jgi:hypothetical protein